MAAARGMGEDEGANGSILGLPLLQDQVGSFSPSLLNKAFYLFIYQDAAATLDAQ
jgi:hypothetical protein